VQCLLNDPQVREIAARDATTRSAAQVDLWAERMAGAVIAIGNAPTALFRLLELIDAGAPKPAAIIGIPVGFVGAVESKAALASDPRGVEFLTVRAGVAAARSPARRSMRWPGASKVMADDCRRQAPWLTMIGIGDNGLESLTPPARRCLTRRDHHRARSACSSGSIAAAREVIPWTFGIKEDDRLLMARRGTPTTILATGDPMHFGIGATLMRDLDARSCG
jgi:hypothetical protein